MCFIDISVYLAVNYYLFIILLFILITQASLCFCMMAVIYTDVGLHLECLPQISRQPFLVYSIELRS